MRTKILAAFLAGGLLVGAGFLTSMISAPGTAKAQEQADAEVRYRPLPRLLGFLEGVMGDLVDDGTITEEQARAIVSAVEDEAAQLKERGRERLEGTRRHLRHRFERGFRMGALLDGGGIDQEEYDRLDPDHPLKQVDVDEYLEDGLITPEELREILHDLKDAPFGDS